MADFMELCLKRQTCRNFSDKPVDKESIMKCLEAASNAPSACNSQPWSFAVAYSQEAVEKVAEAAQQLGSNEYVKKAKAFVVVMEEYAQLQPKIRKLLDSQYFAKSDIGQALAYFCLEAESIGLGTLMIGIFDRELVKETLQLPEEKQVAALIAIGYPAEDTIRPKVRKPTDTVRFV